MAWKELGDATRKAAKDRLKQYFEHKMKDPEGVKFMLDMIDASWELVEKAIEEHGVPSKTAIAMYFASKGNAFIGLSSEQKFQCVNSIVELGVTAVDNPGKVAGPVGWVAYAAFVLYDGLTAYEECDLAYLEYKSDREVEAFRKRLEAQRAMRHAQAGMEGRGNQIDPAVIDQIMSVQEEKNYCGGP
ncbi:MAG TPA: hypothetical protein VG939_21325 [Caulobacteraceae bacterium]|nr:hypothetical protein [Caulobacteraceae bacterium]